jgi:hypothetical protein
MRATFPYRHPMNASYPPKDPQRRYLPPDADTAPALGYDAWLVDELVTGIADLNAEKTTPLADVRKEFGLE